MKKLLFKIYKLSIHLLTVFIPIKQYRRSFRNYFLCTVFEKNKSVIVNNGLNNHFIVFDDNYNEVNVDLIKNIVIKFIGDNNYIKIHKDILLREELVITCTDNNKIFIDKNFRGNFSLGPHLTEGCELYIGKNVSIEGAAFCLFDEPNLKIEILDDCMLSDNIYFRVSDGHTILDKDSKKIVNYPKNILINEHCWIGHSCRILKGSILPANSVLGIGSIYTSSSNMGESGIYAGIPAKLIKKNIDWKRENTDIVLKSERYNND